LSASVDLVSVGALIKVRVKLIVDNG
jgi:hypothetical protein